MMKKSIMILIMVTTGLFCFGQSCTDSVYIGTSDSVKAKVVVKGEDRDSTRAGLAKCHYLLPYFIIEIILPYRSTSTFLTSFKTIII